VTGTVGRVGFSGENDPSFRLTRLFNDDLSTSPRCKAFVVLTHTDPHPSRIGGMSSYVDERQDGGSPPKRGRTDAVPQHIQPQVAASRAGPAAEPPVDDPPLSETPALSKKATREGKCWACGETSSFLFKSASVGFKIAIVLLLGEKFKNFNCRADVCRACDRACVPELTEKCEALVVSLPTSTSIEPLELPARLQSRLSRKQIGTLWADVKERDDTPLYERLLALNAEAPSRSPEDQLVLLPVPPGYLVHISNRYYSR